MEHIRFLFLLLSKASAVYCRWEIYPWWFGSSAAEIRWWRLCSTWKQREKQLLTI